MFGQADGKRPYLISWNVTQRCNLHCSHCYLDSTEIEGGRDLPTEEAMRIVGEIGRLNPHAMLILTGGEGLLRSDIFEIISLASAKGLTVFLGTNGTLLDDDVVRRLIRSGIAGVGVSLDSAGPLFHDRFRGVDGAWNKAVSGIEALKRAGADFQIQFTVTEDNRGELQDIIELSLKMGARALNIFFLVCTGRGRTLTGLEPGSYEALLKAIATAQKAHEGRLMIRARCAPQFLKVLSEVDPESALLKGATSGCIAGSAYMRISPEGFVTPCPYMPADKASPNLLDKGLVEIWETNRRFLELRDPQSQSTRGGCGGCEYEDICGGCRARAMAASKDLSAGDPACDYAPKDDRTAAGQIPPGGPVWSDGARERLERIPLFLREMVSSGVERYARRKGIMKITPEIMAELKRRMP